MKAFDVDDDGIFKKFSHKKEDITWELFYNVYCGDVAEMIQTLLMMYMLLIADIPYGFRMIGSLYDDEPFRFKQLDKMVFKGFRGFDHNELVENIGLS